MDADQISRQLGDMKQGLNVLLRSGRDGRTSELTGAQRFVRHAILQMRDPGVSVAAELRRRFPHLVRAAVSPATTSLPTWASELLAADLLALLATGSPPSLFTQLRDLGLGLGLDGGFKSVPIPIPSSSPLSAWISEGSPVPDLRLAFSSANLGAKKVSSLTVFTGELAKRSVGDIETILGALLQNDIRRLIDRSLVDANPATAARPAGLLSSIVPIAASEDLNTVAAMTEDLKALVGAILALHGTAPVFLVSPMAAISLAALPSALAIPTIFSPEIPVGQIIAIDGPSFVSNLAAPEIEKSDEAVIHESDTPLPLASGGVLATPLRSLWQSNSHGLLCRFDADWVCARVAVINGATW